MNMKDIKGIALKQGVKTGKMKKDDIIRAIQRAEGNFDCFGTAATSNCSQSDCLWREDCLKM
jgi:hypothetical protein